MRNMIGIFTKNGARAALLAAVAAVSTGSAVAATTISSSATDLSISLSALTLPVGLTVGTASGTAGAAYNVDNTFLGVNQGLGLGGGLNQGVTTGVLRAAAASNGTTGSATASVNGLGLNLSVLGLTTVGLGTGLITSNTVFDGATLTGSSSVANLTLSSLLFSVPLDAGLLASTAANRTLVNILGLTVTLNEQIASDMTLNGINTRSLTTNALRVSYRDFLIGGSLLSGDIIVGQSQVSVAQPVPEPATWAMMIVGFGMVGGVLRRQQRQVRALA